MGPYQPLAKLFYQDASSSRYSANEQEARRRLEDPSTFRTGIMLEHGELFLAIPRELTIQHELMLRAERRVSKLWSGLPGIAQWAYIRGLIMDEIVSSNNIEGIHSSRREIADALDSQQDDSRPDTARRFREFARLYLELTDKNRVFPHEPEDVRNMYNRIVGSEIETSSLPDGKLFRAGEVDILSTTQKTLHRGVSPESRITEMITQMIELASSDDIPAVYAALLSHFLFEYIHPFYDGNGRTGRYLLALYLSEPLSLVTTLSLSRVIAENKTAYYRAFDSVEKPMNHAEGTFFVIAMVNFIRQAQEEAIENLERKDAQLDKILDTIEEVSRRVKLSGKARDVLFAMAQSHLFVGELGENTPARIAEYLKASPQTARKYLQELEDTGLAAPATRRPLRYILTEEACRQLGLVESS